MEQPDPQTLLTPRRKVTGISAVLLPYNHDHTVDWKGFESLLQRTLNAGLIPAVNMDTGYGNLIDEATRLEVLRLTRALTSGKPFVGGVFVVSNSCWYPSFIHVFEFNNLVLAHAKCE